jgi:hypothetical protein
MKHIYLSFVLLLACATNLQAQTGIPEHFTYSLELIGTNATTGNYEVALIATPNFTAVNGNSADMGTIISFSPNLYVTDAGFVNECTTSGPPTFTTTCQYAITADEWSLEHIQVFSDATGRNVFAFIRTETGVSTFFDAEAGVPIIMAVFQVFHTGTGLPTSGDLVMLENDSELVGPSFYDGGWLNIKYPSISGFTTIDMYGGNDPEASGIDFASLSTQNLELEENSFYLYPNPANDIVSLKGNTAALERVEIYSISGQKVAGFTGNVSTLNTAALPSGVYLVKLDTAESSTTLKLVKS